jgi:hypothetical protein
MITLTFAELLLIILIAPFVWNKALDFVWYRKSKNQSYMNPEREEITDEMIVRQMKTLGKMFRKMPPEHRAPVAYVLELLRRDINYQLGFFAAERKARNKNGG